MKKWRKQYHIPGLNIMCVKKNFGNVYYLIGCGSHFQIYQVLKNLQTHTYKSYQSSFCNFIYKQIFTSLFQSVSYQRDAFDKFKITSSQIKVFQSKSKSKRQIKFLQFLFELDQYMSSVSFVQKFKKFIQEEYEIIGLIIEKESEIKVVEFVKNMRFCAFTVVQRKSQMSSTVFIVEKKKEIADKIYQMEINYEHLDQLIIGVRFLRGIGKTYEKLKSVNLQVQLQDTQLSELELFLKNNFAVEINMIKNSFEIKVIKNQVSNSSYCDLISKIL